MNPIALVHPLISKLAAVYRDETFWVATRHALHAFRLRCFPPQDHFDQIYHTRTTGRLQPWELGNHADARFGKAYDPVWAGGFEEAMQQLSVTPQSTTFIDLGSGKGRALILASEYGFASIIGVEYSERLMADARRNLEITGTSATLICQSAADYVFPSEPLVVFLFNPFGPEILQSVLSHLYAHDAFVVYVTPLHAGAFTQFPRFTLVYDKPYLKIWRIQPTDKETCKNGLLPVHIQML